MNTKKHKLSVDQIQNLEIDRNGRVMPRLNDLDPLENTLLSVLYPGIKVASVNVPVEPLDEYEEASVENALAKLVWKGIHYKLVGASGSAKKGKFYFVDQEHSRAIAERFQHWPQAAIVYFGILVSPCRVMIEEPDARVLVVPDHALGTNDCRGWIRRSVFGKLQQKHDAEVLEKQVRRLVRQQSPNATDEDLPLNVQGAPELEDQAKREIACKTLRAHRFYQFRMAFHDTQAKGAFKIMEDDVADALAADFILPESAVKPGMKMPAAMYSIFGPGRRFRGRIAVGIREFSRQLEFESSYTLVEHAPDDSIQLEILPQAMEQVRKLSGAVGTGHYAELLEILGRPQESSPGDGSEQGDSDELNVIEGLLLADASGHIVRHPYVNNQLNKLLARWAFRVATGGGFRLPAFALADDGYLFVKDGSVFHGSDWIPEHKAIVPLASSRGLCVRYPIRMFDDLLPFDNLSDTELGTQLKQDLSRQKCVISDTALEGLIARQLRLEGTYVLHSDTAKKNGGDYDFDWICLIESDRFPRFVESRFRRGEGQQQGKTKLNKAKDPWFNLEHVAMKARGNHIGSITDLMTSCRAEGREDLADLLAKELQNALDSLKWQVQPNLTLVADIRQQVNQAPWLRYKKERRISELPLHLDVADTDRVGKLYNHVRKDIEDLLTNKAPIEAFKGLVVGEEVSREMLEDCHFVNRAYAAIVSKVAERHEQLKQSLENARADWDAVRKSSDRDLRKGKLSAKTKAQGDYRFDEDRGKYEMKAILAYIRIWAQSKTKDRKAWLQALNRIVCGGKGSGSILFLAFPQELIDKLAERTGGRFVRVHLPQLSAGSVHTDSTGRTFLVEPVSGGGEKQTFLWKYKDGKILLDDDNPAIPADNCALSNDPSGTASLPEADLDDVEFSPITFTEEEGRNAAWTM
jgi:hypothetical protein